MGLGRAVGLFQGQGSELQRVDLELVRAELSPPPRVGVVAVREMGTYRTWASSKCRQTSPSRPLTGTIEG
jgi:hypothetical protein